MTLRSRRWGSVLPNVILSRETWMPGGIEPLPRTSHSSYHIVVELGGLVFNYRFGLFGQLFPHWLPQLC